MPINMTAEVYLGSRRSVSIGDLKKYGDEVDPITEEHDRAQFDGSRSVKAFLK